MDETAQPIPPERCREGWNPPLNFYRRLSIEESSADEVDIYFTYTSEQYFQDREQLMDIVRKALTA